MVVLELWCREWSGTLFFHQYQIGMHYGILPFPASVLSKDRAMVVGFLFLPGLILFSRYLSIRSSTEMNTIFTMLCSLSMTQPRFRTIFVATQPGCTQLTTTSDAGTSSASLGEECKSWWGQPLRVRCWVFMRDSKWDASTRIITKHSLSDW